MKSISHKLGQIFSFGFLGEKPSADIYTLIAKYNIGNFILFGRNIGTLEEVSMLNQYIHDICMEKLNISPIISLDQEGGMVSRLFNTDESLVFFPSARVLSYASDEDTKYIYDMMGKAIKKLGFTMNLAPVVDINSNPLNPVIGSRSYGKNVDIVIKKSKICTTSHLDNKLVPVAKHFPGHGDTDIDSHFFLPQLEKKMEALEEHELVPFKELIKMGVPAIMPAHIIYNKLDSLPATLSKKILQILKDELDFDGLILSDCMRMKAIENNYETPCVMAIEAGIDICGVSYGYEKQLQIRKNCMNWAQKNQAVLDTRYNKIINWKNKHNHFEINYSQVQSIIQNKDLYHKITNIYIQSFVSNDKKTFQNMSISNTFIIDFFPYTVNDAEDQGQCCISFYKTLQKKYNTNIQGIAVDAQSQIDEALVKNQDSILIITYRTSQNIYQIELANLLLSMGKKVIIIYTVDEIENIDESQKYLLIHEYSKGSVNACVSYILEDT